jgi:hypothetical protein
MFTEPLPRNGLHNPIVLLLLGADHIENTCHVSDCEFIGPLQALGVARTI